MGYTSGKRKKNKTSGKSVAPRPDYLHMFLEFALKNMVEYDEKIAAGESVDWRIKEALMFAIGTIRDNITGQKDLKGQMEGNLVRFVLPELKSPQPFMRLRAC